MQAEPLVSVIIPTYNRKKLAERLINSILRSTYKNVEIIAVDDASPDGTSEYMKSKFSYNKKVKIFRNKQNMFAAGTKNVGQEKAKGNFILFADDDNVLDSYMIENLVRVFLENPNIGEAGPVYYNFNDKKSVLMSRSTRNMFTTKTYHLRSLAQFKNMKIWPTDDVPNSFMVRGDVVKKNNIRFRPKFGIMYEESDYAYRIKKAGYKIVMVRDAKVYHDIEDSRGSQKKDYLYHFMVDKRRPFVFARNRIIFHWLYSSRIQNLFILCFWVWLFNFYYAYKFLFYGGYSDFSFKNRVLTTLSYVRGTLDGIYLLLSPDKFAKDFTDK